MWFHSQAICKHITHTHTNQGQMVVSPYVGMAWKQDGGSNGCIIFELCPVVVPVHRRSVVSRITKLHYHEHTFSEVLGNTTFPATISSSSPSCSKTLSFTEASFSNYSLRFLGKNQEIMMYSMQVNKRSLEHSKCSPSKPLHVSECLFAGLWFWTWIVITALPCCKTGSTSTRMKMAFYNSVTTVSVRNAFVFLLYSSINLFTSSLWNWTASCSR